MNILDLLELPQLIDACVRNGLIEGALEISAFANVLERRHSRRSLARAQGDETGGPASTDGSSVITGVVSEIRSSMVTLRSNLVRQLRAANLPTSLNVVSSLRRLDTLVLEKAEKSTPAQLKHLSLALELKLMVDFLDARSVWLREEIQGVQQRSGPDATYQWLLDVVEKNRTMWFEIGTQFRAIFTDETSASGSSTANLLLSSWLLRRVENFVALLRQHAPLVQVRDPCLATC
jgi:hypothetical protein